MASSPSPATTHEPSGALLGDVYSNRIPSPPAIYVEIPNTDKNYGGREIEIGPVDPSSDADFLRPGQMSQVAGMAITMWSYENRRAAQPILPFLFIGPASFTRNQGFLKENAITMLFGIKPSRHSIIVTAPAQRSANELGIPLHMVDADSTNDMTSLYKNVIPIMNQHLSQMAILHDTDSTRYPSPGRIFLFCDSGNHYSASLAAAYLMKTFYNVNHLKAISCVMTSRFSCDFDDTMRQSLLTWNNWLEAERNVCEALKSPSFFPTSGPVKLMKQKRSFCQDVEDDEMEVDGVNDEERFAGRRMTPFIDG